VDGDASLSQESNPDKLPQGEKKSAVRFEQTQNDDLSSGPPTLVAPPAKVEDMEEEGEAQETYDFMKLCRAKNSAEMLKSMSFDININKLYSLEQAFCDNQFNEYCAVLLRVENKQLRQVLGGKYLVQVWNKQGQLMYERCRGNSQFQGSMLGVYFTFEQEGNMSVKHDEFHVEEKVQTKTY